MGVNNLCYGEEPVAVIHAQFTKAFETLAARDKWASIFTHGILKDIDAIKIESSPVESVYEKNREDRLLSLPTLGDAATLPVATPQLAPLPGARHISDDKRPFLEAIWHDPTDDAPLLIYADWLDEHNENAVLVRWWVKAREKSVPKIKPGKKRVKLSDLNAAAKQLFNLHGQSACVLATVAVHWWQERLHPVDYDSIRPYYADADALKSQIDGAWLAVELAGMGVLPAAAIDAARNSASAAVQSALAVVKSAPAAGHSARAASESAWAVGESTWAASVSALAAGNSVWAARDLAWAAEESARAACKSTRGKPIRIALAVFEADWWAGLNDWPLPSNPNEKTKAMIW